jgi:acid stress-induced BolA-like protein IbaG/YrbA
MKNTNTELNPSEHNPTPEKIREYIANDLPCQLLKVTGDGHHFEAVIVTHAFEGKSYIERHKMVYKILGERMRQEIHALSMQTFTPKEFDKS